MEAVQTTAQKLIGQTVKHRAFGSGVIEELTGNVVTVNFSDGDKKFIYPDAFESFLSLEDEESMKEFNKLMENRRIRIQAKRQEQHEKDVTRKRIYCIKIGHDSHAVFSVDNNGVKEFEEKGYAFTGRYMSGFSEGRARTAGRIKPNSLCFLTVLEKGKPETERVLRGIFMAAEDFYGDECTDGQVKAHKKYCIMLDKNSLFRLWEPVAETEVPKRFGGICFRYVSEDAAKKILLAVRERLGEEKKELADEFYEYFCKVNKISAAVK